jgi:hypothetical protein
MRFELGYHVVFVLEQHLGSGYTYHQMLEAVGPGQIVRADNLD